MQIQEVLEAAAREERLLAKQMHTHTLRIGGSTALYHIYKDVELIKRYGRWVNTAFHACLCKSNEMASGIATKMAADKTSLQVGYKLP